MVGPKIAIIGANGLLGRALMEKLPGAIPLAHGDIEITDKENTKKVLNDIKPDIVINCAAILNVDQCEKEPEKCYAVNRDGVSNLLNAMCYTPYATFVQISSSEVFGRSEGFKTEGYIEDEDPVPESVYQKSKAEAEKIVIKFARDNPRVLKNWYIARAGWLYGAGRKTFVENFLENLQKKDELTVVKDQWRSPTWTRDFADGLSKLLNLETGFPSGIYHITSEVKEEEATTTEVIEEIKNFLGPKFANPPIKLVSQKDFFKVPRAPSNVLKNTKLPMLPYWRDSLREYLKTHT